MKALHVKWQHKTFRVPRLGLSRPEVPRPEVPRRGYPDGGTQTVEPRRWYPDRGTFSLLNSSRSWTKAQSLVLLTFSSAGSVGLKSHFSLVHL